jgi:hypothetical protein
MQYVGDDSIRVKRGYLYTYMYIARAWYGLVKFWITISAVPLRCTVRCTVIRYGTEIRRTAVFIRF